jgi:serine kinase of HPr protein (carbohydrate metabolism regulator)
MKKKLTLETIIQGRASALGIKEIFSDFSLKKKISRLNVKRYGKVSWSDRGNSLPHIAVINPQVLNHFRISEKEIIGRAAKDYSPQNVLLLICSGASSVPDFFRNYARKYNIAVAASVLDEDCLQSRLTGLIRERLHDATSLHGVVVEVQRKGILIVGASGIGKTSAALGLLQDGHHWVADDIALIKKNARGELVASGHKKIRNLIYTERTGITAVSKLINSHKIRRNTKLKAMIEIERIKTTRKFIAVKEKEILETNLPCLHVGIPLCSYFDKNLLKKTLRQLPEDN